MVFSIDLKSEEHKNWLIRAMALIITALCVVNLHDAGEPRPLYISIPRGIINSLLLNGTLWLSSFRMIRVKLKFPVAIFLFVSSLGVFVATPFSRVLAIFFVIFYLWVIYGLFSTKVDV